MRTGGLLLSPSPKIIGDAECLLSRMERDELFRVKNFDHDSFFFFSSRRKSSFALLHCASLFSLRPIRPRPHLSLLMRDPKSHLLSLPIFEAPLRVPDRSLPTCRDFLRDVLAELSFSSIAGHARCFPFYSPFVRSRFEL